MKSKFSPEQIQEYINTRLPKPVEIGELYTIECKLNLNNEIAVYLVTFICIRGPQWRLLDEILIDYTT
ncbi:hypothetical protein D3C80_1949650 [compost metagenome]